MRETKFKETEIGKIPEDWGIKELGQACSRIIDCSHAKKPQFIKGSEFIFLEVENISDDGFLNFENAKFITKEDYAAWTKRLVPQKDDIVITKTGRIGASALIPENIKVCIGRNQVILRADNSCLESHYLWHFLHSDVFRRELKRLALSGTILDSLHVKYVPKIRIPFPDVTEQKRIVSFLDSISYRMKLSKATNTTLESIGQALFKRWFVDFEFPDENGEPYKSSGGEMIDSKLGEIPKGWHAGRYCDVVTNIKEALKPGEHLSNRRYVPIDSLPMKSIGLIDDKSYAEAKSSLIAFEKNDILFGAMRAYFHRVNFAPYKGVTRTTTFVLRPAKDYYLSYSLFLLNQESSVDYANQHSKGSTMPYAVWENGLASMLIVIPDDETLRAYHDLISPLLQKVSEVSEQNIILSQIRDLLLPRLMSGRIRVEVGS